MGIAIRTGSPLSLNLAEPVWKQLAGMTLSTMDIGEVDRDYLPGLLYIRDYEGDDQPLAFLDYPFSTQSAAGHEINLSPHYKKITMENRGEFFRLAVNYR